MRRPLSSSLMVDNPQPRAAAILVALLGVLAFAGRPAQAQDRHVRFRSIGIQGVSAPVQDVDGFLWMASPEGLARYDGSRTIVYSNDPSDSTSIPHNTMGRPIPSASGGVWVGFPGEGVARFDPETETFRRYLRGLSVSGLFEAADGTLWVGSAEGAFRLDPRSGAVTHFAVDATAVYEFLEGPNGDVWFGTARPPEPGGAMLYRVPAGSDSLDRFVRYDPADSLHGRPRFFGLPRLAWRDDGTLLVGSIGLYTLDEATRSLVRFAAFDPLADAWVFQFSRDHSGRLMVATDRGVFRFETTDEPPTMLIRSSARNIEQDRDGAYWFVSLGGSVIRFDPETGRSYDYWIHDPLDPESPPTRPADIFQDRAGIMWLNDGKWFDPVGPTFRPIRSTDTASRGYAGQTPFAMARASDGALWVATMGSGAFRQDPETGTWTNFRKDDSRPGGGLPTDDLWSMVPGEAGAVWIGTNGYGLLRLDPTGRVEQWNDRDDGSMPGARGVIQELTALPDGRVRVHDIDRMFEFDPRTRTFEATFDRIETGPSPAGKIIIGSAEDARGRLWIATQDDGLFRLSADRRSSVQFYHRSDVAGGLRTNQVYEIKADTSGSIFVATPRGIHRILDSEPDTLIVRQYGSEAGLESGSVGLMEFDDVNRLWFTHAASLAVLDVETETVRVFERDRDIPEFLGEWSGYGALNDPASDLMLFGGSGGVLAFRPDELLVSPRQPDVVVSGLRRYDDRSGSEQAILVPAPWREGEVELRHTDTVIELDLGDRGMANGGVSQFAYRLEGFSDGWFELGDRREMTLTNLDPGRYTLWLKARDAAGAWSEEKPVLRIRQLPPWWLSTLAYVLYGVFFVGGAIGADRFQRHRLVLRERRRAELREAELKAEAAAAHAETAVAEAEAARAQAGEAEAARRALQAENERKEVELAKARELEDAFRALEAAHARLQETQEQLIHAEKMASLGELTSGIAHEIKNPLNFVNNFAELDVELADELQEELDRGEFGDDIRSLVADLKRNAQQIAVHGKRADAIVASMLAHASGGAGRKEALDPIAQAAEFASVAYHAFQTRTPGFECHLVIEPADEPCVTLMDGREMGRVWLNILNNAFWAANERARAEGAGFEPTVRVSGRRSADRVEIRIADNGAGIPEEKRRKVFEPFYTTKPTGSGNTGLGLSLAHDIVAKGHSGQVAVEETPGGGATFVISLPVVEGG